MRENLILIGFSGSGKSAVGRRLARLLGMRFVDTDREIEARAGKTTALLFDEEGEAAFRALEKEAIQTACSGQGRVIATGGGAFLDPQSRLLMMGRGMVVYLDASPGTIYQRLSQKKSGHEIRPLLAGPDPLAQIMALRIERQPFYRMAHGTIDTDGSSEEEVTYQVGRLWHRFSQDTGEDKMYGEELAATVHHALGSYPILVGRGLLQRLGTMLRNVGISGTIYIISDDTVFRTYGRQVQVSLEHNGLSVHSFVVPPGEESKTLTLAQDIYQWLAGIRAERSHTVVALGGGVVGDLAGLVAATYVRGMGFVQVPTSMAAMVDASIGGKVAVNLPQGKNLVGAFYQPAMVVADLDTLSTLGRREIAEGWAEAIKHGLILDSVLFDTFEEHAESLLVLEEDATIRAIRRSVAIKAQVVGEDERENLGKRTILNYGHTIGHALETASGYGRYLHGEAVSVGMMGAARLGQRLGITSEEIVMRQCKLLERFGLPTTAPTADSQAILDAMLHDKKSETGSIQWVLLEDVGQAIIQRHVPLGLVEETVRELTA